MLLAITFDEAVASPSDPYDDWGNAAPGIRSSVLLFLLSLPLPLLVKNLAVVPKAPAACGVLLLIVFVVSLRNMVLAMDEEEEEIIVHSVAIVNRSSEF